MRLVVNGESFEWPGDGCLPALLEELGAPAASVATLVNGDVVPAARRESCRLRDGDRVDLLTFAAGG